MRTDYKYGLDKNRRELSYYQSAEWCRHILTLKKTKPDFRGERNPHAKIAPLDVIRVRSYNKMPRVLARELAGELRVAVPYIYQLRKWENGRYKKWPHLVSAPAAESVLA